MASLHEKLFSWLVLAWLRLRRTTRKNRLSRGADRKGQYRHLSGDSDVTRVLPVRETQDGCVPMLPMCLSDSGASSRCVNDFFCFAT
jgi:hypothetical protein